MKQLLELTAGRELLRLLGGLFAEGADQAGRDSVLLGYVLLQPPWFEGCCYDLVDLIIRQIFEPPLFVLPAWSSLNESELLQLLFLETLVIVRGF